MSQAAYNAFLFHYYYYYYANFRTNWCTISSTTSVQVFLKKRRKWAWTLKKRINKCLDLKISSSNRHRRCTICCASHRWSTASHCPSSHNQSVVGPSSSTTRSCMALHPPAPLPNRYVLHWQHYFKKAITYIHFWNLFARIVSFFNPILPNSPTMRCTALANL